jgi:hypothetical protein
MKANYNSYAGVAYQLVSTDPLIDANQCALDAALMKTLGANAIRVYHVDSTADHKPCMDVFADAGVYLFVDLDNFDTQIEQVSFTPTCFGIATNKILGQPPLERDSAHSIQEGHGFISIISQHSRLFCWQRGDHPGQWKHSCTLCQSRCSRSQGLP